MSLLTMLYEHEQVLTDQLFKMIRFAVQKVGLQETYFNST